MDASLDQILQAFTGSLEQPTLKSCSRWCSKRRIMGGDFPGPYSWKFHPWVKGMLDSTATYNYALKSAQMGVTEVLINRALYTVDVMKREALYVLPTTQLAQKFSKSRFDVALECSPYLKSIFTDTNRVDLKRAGTANLHIGGSRGGVNLKSTPANALFLDEVDEMELAAIWALLERLSGKLHKECWGISTPTIPNFGIHRLYLPSTQEHFFFKCPRCGRRTELVWPDCVEIVGESVNDPRCKESFLKCKECKNRLPHEEKPEWLKPFDAASNPAGANWEPTANLDSDIRGFYINQLYSFTVNPGELVVAYHRGFSDDAANKEFHNSKLGMPWVGEGAQIDEDTIEQCKSTHSIKDARPTTAGKRFITMGVDQGKVSYYSIVEWAFEKFEADLNYSARAKLVGFGTFMEGEWPLLYDLMREWQVLHAVVDMDPEVTQARLFAKKFRKYVHLCRYRSGRVGREITISQQDTDAPVATVDRTSWMTTALSRFRTKRIALPRDITETYKSHLMNVVRTYRQDKNGEQVATFVETGPDHFSHSLTYAEIALPLAASFSTGRDIPNFL